ncbi:MAG: TonB-dependent receptor [Bacteroidota bacterium]
MLRKIYLLFLTVLAALPVLAQPGSGSVKGKLTDQSNGEAMPFANVVAKRNGVVVSGAQTDFDGGYFIKPLEPGSYDIEASFPGYQPKKIAGVLVKSDQITFLDIKISQSELQVVEVVSYKVPLIDKDAGPSGGTVRREDIMRMPGRSGESIANTVGGVTSTSGGISIRGSRPDGGNFIYIDGVKVRGSSNLPKASLEEVKVITGGIPANYGDATGGIISYTTRGPASEFSGSIEGVSSGFKSGDKAVGLDAYGYNLIEGYVNGPIWSKTDADGNRKPVLGFSASLNYNSQVDASRSPIGYNVLTDSEYSRLYNNLLVPNPTQTGVNPSAQELRASSFENVKTGRNTGSQNVAGSAKIDVTTTPTINLTFGGSFNYNKARQFSVANMAFNSDNNSTVRNFDWRAYGRFTQRFKSNEESASNVKNIYYSVLVDYSETHGLQQNEAHKKNFFDYGYVGKFDILKNASAPFALTAPDSSGLRYLEQQALRGDSIVIFTPGTQNPTLARYTEEYFNTFNAEGGFYQSLDQVVGRGLRNGDSPLSIYDRFNALGTPFGSYNRNDFNQFRVSASGSADIGDHAITAGFEYEQRTDRNFGYSNLVSTNRTNNLWAIARSKTNSHLTELDKDNPIITYFDENGNQLQFPVITYNTLINSASQTAFDRNLRTSLGLNVNGDDQINIDALDPSQLKMEYFSADELVNSGNSLVNYYGYDVYGNKLNSRPSFEGFFTDRDQYGQYANKIGAFQPIYFAGYVMDKFAFDDIIFNIGLRVDRFDANQKVLKDKYLFKEAYNAGELRDGSTPFSVPAAYAIPTNIGDDYTVYVDDPKAPKAILGYRSGNQFYDRQGRVANAEAVRNSSRVIAPAIKNITDDPRLRVVEPQAFKDYVPQINLMPRIAFSFPISDEANFTAHYDILTRRPVSNNRLDLIRYTYLVTYLHR